jgi:transcriptional regulator with XRE-family HTH domain
MKTLKRYMRENRLNQTEVAEMLDTDRFRISRWLNGRQKPSLTSIEKIAKVTDTGVYQTLQEWGLL